MPRLFSDSLTSYKVRADDEKLPSKKKVFAAYEGSKNEQKYFNNLAEFLKGNKKCTADFFPVNRLKSDGRSDPISVKNGLEEYYLESIKNMYDKKKDELWIVIDTDNHFDRKDLETTDVFTKYLDELVTKDGIKIKAAISNPCFELWQILHYKCPTTLDLDEIRTENANNRNHIKALCNVVRSEVADKDYYSKVHVASNNAKNNQLCQNNYEIISKLGTTVYQLIDSIIDS